MDVAIVGVVATLLGTAIGGVVSYIATRRNSVSERVHESRIDAYKSFAAAAMELRRTLMNRWFVEHGRPGTAADDVYTTRSTAWSAYYAVQLVSHSDEVSGAAKRALEAVSALKDAADDAQLVADAEQCRVLIGEFVTRARTDIAAHTRVG
ncbi:hypothetical protein [Pseudolysinimonas sp.]